jgi:DNA-binding beta-propeller fold protein YncE
MQRSAHEPTPPYHLRLRQVRPPGEAASTSQEPARKSTLRAEYAPAPQRPGGVGRRAIFVVCAAILLGLATCAYALVGGPALPLRTLADVPLSGTSSRLDYESFDAAKGILYIAHLGADSVIAVDPERRRVMATIAGTPAVRGVLAVGELNRVYAAAEGTGDVVVIDSETMRIIARVAAGNVDGLAYDPHTKRLFVSDESGGKDTVIDTRSNQVVARIELGGEAGNTVYDRVSGHIFVAVQTRNDIAEIDPSRNTIIRRHATRGCIRAHGLVIDGANHSAFVGCQVNAQLVRVDLLTNSAVRSGVGIDPDVLALDEGLHRLYVASESGIVSIFDVRADHFSKLGQSFYAPNAHVVGVDQRTHHVFFPLAGLNGRPVLRIAAPIIGR